MLGVRLEQSSGCWVSFSFAFADHVPGICLASASICTLSYMYLHHMLVICAWPMPGICQAYSCNKGLDMPSTGLGADSASWGTHGIPLGPTEMSTFQPDQSECVCFVRVFAHFEIFMFFVHAFYVRLFYFGWTQVAGKPTNVANKCV